MDQHNSRKFKRTKFVFPVRIKILSNKEQNPDEEHFHAFSDNISEGGLKILLQKEIKLNAKLELRFDLIIKGEMCLIKTIAEVVRVAPNRKGQFEYGIIFEPLKEENWIKINEFLEEYCI